MRESGKSDCIQANGQRLDDQAFTVASWDFPLGTQLWVCRTLGQYSMAAAPCVEVQVTDRGPRRRLYRQGRLLDLSLAAFQALAPLEQGLVEIEVEEATP